MLFQRSVAEKLSVVEVFGLSREPVLDGRLLKEVCGGLARRCASEF